METKIQAALQQLEADQNIQILFACETGSRAWGFPSPDSDYDIRIIYRRETSWYLSLSDKKDTIEQMLENGDLDITGWDIKKCLKLMWKSNAALLERLQSPIVYREVAGFSELMLSYSERCFSPIATLHHYLGLAKNTFSDIDGREEIKLKKLFYALRSTLACKWIIEQDSVPPIPFAKMVDELDFPESLKNRIRELVGIKSGKNESYIHPAEEELNIFIRKELEKAIAAAATLGGRKDPSTDLDALFLRLLENDGKNGYS